MKKKNWFSKEKKERKEIRFTEKYLTLSVWQQSHSIVLNITQNDAMRSGV